MGTVLNTVGDLFQVFAWILSKEPLKRMRICIRLCIKYAHISTQDLKYRHMHSSDTHMSTVSLLQFNGRNCWCVWRMQNKWMQSNSVLGWLYGSTADNCIYKEVLGHLVVQSSILWIELVFDCLKSNKVVLEHWCTLHMDDFVNLFCNSKRWQLSVDWQNGFQFKSELISDSMKSDGNNTKCVCS